MSKHQHPLTVEYALLGLLREQPMHGYEIHQRIQSCGDDGLVWRAKQGMLYVMLARLESEGLLTSLVETEGARPPRKLYCLTAKGDALLLEWLQTPIRNGRDFRLEFLTKLYFAQRAGGAVALVLVQRQLGATQVYREQLVQNVAHTRAQGAFVALVSDFRIGQMDAALNWLHQCEKLFAAEQYEEEQIR